MIKKIIVSTILIVLLVGILGIGYLKINNPKEETINTEITKNISKEDKEESTDKIIVDEKIEEIETPKNNKLCLLYFGINMERTAPLKLVESLILTILPSSRLPLLLLLRLQQVRLQIRFSMVVD